MDAAELRALRAANMEQLEELKYLRERNRALAAALLQVSDELAAERAAAAAAEAKPDPDEVTAVTVDT